MMRYKGYIGKVEFDAKAGILHGEVIGIRDVVSFQGQSVPEVQRAFRESVDDYLVFCKERGEDPDKPTSGQFIVRLDSDLHRKANMLASATGKSLNSWVAECLAREVAQELPRHRPKETDIPAHRHRRQKPAGAKLSRSGN